MVLTTAFPRRELAAADESCHSDTLVALGLTPSARLVATDAVTLAAEKVCPIHDMVFCFCFCFPIGCFGVRIHQGDACLCLVFRGHSSIFLSLQNFNKSRCWHLGQQCPIPFPSRTWSSQLDHDICGANTCDKGKPYGSESGKTKRELVSCRGVTAVVCVADGHIRRT